MFLNHSSRYSLNVCLFISTMLCVCTAKAAPVDTRLTQWLERSHLGLQAGGYWRSAASTQQIDINGLIGDLFVPSSAMSKDSSNGFLGVGYFLDGQKGSHYSMSYGLNWFYLAPTTISGDVYQEDQFNNLTFSYRTTHYPLYAMAKSTLSIPHSKQELSFNVGIGPNWMNLSSFNEQPVANDDGINAIPDYIFSAHTTTTFSATAGVALKLNHLLNNMPLECGYQFFYLGNGSLDTVNDQVLNSLHTGSLFANALMCSVII